MRMGRSRLRRIALVLLLLAVWQAMAAASSFAHTASQHYTYLTWDVTGVENYQIAGGVPQIERVRVSIVNGADTWNALSPGPTLVYNGYSSQAPIVAPSCDVSSRSFIFQRDLPEAERLAEAWLCGTLSGNIRADAFHITFDTRPWHSDVSLPAPGDYDRWSVASHEFGHAMGHWVHWPDNSTRCVNEGHRLTMCSIIYPGTTFVRDLGDHDIHTYEAQY